MDTSGRPNEGWLTVIPLGILILVVVSVMGGPAAFANTLTSWGGDLIDLVAGWLKWL